MLHKRSSILTLLILALLTCSLAACKAKELPDEPYTAVDYNLYPAPQDAYVGDTMPFVTDDGTLELYYLYDTDHNGMGYHPVYKYSTKDLCSYEDHGKVLDFGQLSDPDRIPIPRSAPAPSCRIKTASTTFSTPGITTPETAARARNA